VNRQGLAVVIVAAALAIAAWTVYRGRIAWVAPDFALEDLDGKAVRLSNFRGRVVFINVWTTWCEPCRAEMPSMEVLNKKLAGDGFVMLAINADAGDREDVEAFVEELGLTFPILLDPGGQVAGRYRVTGYPETFIVDRNGVVVSHEIGPRNWSEPRFEQALRALMASGVYEAPS
jgi:cytochrome c biogenesis protein CcmG/thiol:disulfide interchange protein DsbE